jgi:hypothetical protein
MSTMSITRPIRIVASIAALVAVAFGMGTYTHANFPTFTCCLG